MANVCRYFCKELKAFGLRGNVIDVAIGIIVATAFTNLVESLVEDIITPPLGFILGGMDFINFTIKMKNFVHNGQPPVVIRYGKFIQTIITIFAMVVFSIIKGSNKLYPIVIKKKQNKENEEIIQLKTSEEIKVLCEIRDLLAKQYSVAQ